MAVNPILEELHEIRAQILEEHGDDLSAYMQQEFERLKAAGHPIANVKQRRINRRNSRNQPVSAGDSGQEKSGVAVAR